MLLAGAVFVFFFALYMLVYPIFLRYTAASDEAVAADGDYRWLEEQVSALAKVRDAADGVLPVSIPITSVKEKIERDLESRKIKARVKLENTGITEQVKINIEKVRGKLLMGWLEELANNGYVISEIKLRSNRGLLSGNIAVGI